MTTKDFAELVHLRLRCGRCRSILASSAQELRDEWRRIGLACPGAPCEVDRPRAWLELPPAVVVDGDTEVDLRNLSFRCGRCDDYPTLTHYDRGDGVWNVYTYACENEICDPDADVLLLEVRATHDRFARRDPAWRGGRVHAGAEPSGD